MIPVYNYRNATIEGFYDPEFDEEGFPTTMKYTAYVQHPQVKAIACYTADTWEEARHLAETAIDELIESWN